MKKIAIASDHAGFYLKQLLIDFLEEKGFTMNDYGTNGANPVDYSDYIYPAAERVADGTNDLGIVLGGSGNGEAITANKVKGIRCAVCWNEESAKLAKEHNNANIISIGAKMVDSEMAFTIVDIWLNTRFEGGRHIQRIDKIHSYEFDT